MSWKLSAREASGTPFNELGDYPNLAGAARKILETENDQQPALFFRLYVDPAFGPSDTEVLCRLEYQSPTRFYLLKRSAH